MPIPVIALLVSLAIFLIFSVPIFLALFFSTALSLGLSDLSISPMAIIQRAVQGVNIAPLLAIPLFIFAADIISRGEIGERLVAVATASVGHIPGGLAAATAFTMGVFGAISGVGVAAIVSIGPIVYPMLLRQGYTKTFSIGLILSGSTLSMLIPPSVAVILYCLVTNQSIAKAFLVTFVAGIIFMLLLSVYGIAYALRHDLRAPTLFSWALLVNAVTRAAWAIGLPVIILGGIYSGFLTVTEAAAASVVYAIFVEFVIYRRLQFQHLVEIGRTSIKTIAMILILIAAGSAMTWLITLERLPQALTLLLGAQSAQGLITTIDGIFLIAGMFIDPNSATIILAPLLQPAALAAGIDGIHLAGVVTVCLAIGMITPPFGLNLFVGMVTFKASFGEVVRGCSPFLCIEFIVLILITYLPDVVMWLPNMTSIS